MDQATVDDAPGLNPGDRDALIRTVLTEGAQNDPQAWASVAAVVRNRLAAGGYGSSVSQIVKAPGQFEVWSNGRAQGVDPRSDAYQQAGRIVDAIAGGLPDPTNGATHFFSPAGQASLGRDAPAWGGRNVTAVMAGHVYSAPNGRVDLGISTDPQPVAPAAASQPQAKASAPMANSDTLKRWGVSLEDNGGASAISQATPTQPSRTAAQGDTLSRWGVSLGDAPAATTAQPPQGTPSAAGAPVAAGDDAAAVGRGLINGVPVAGPYILGDLNRAAAVARAITKDEPYSQALQEVQQFGDKTAEAYPFTTGVSQIIGGGLAMAPIAAAAPVPFGLRGATLAGRMLMGGASNAALGAADATARGDNPMLGAGLGLAGGAAGPLVGRIASGVAGGALSRLGEGYNALSNYLSTGSGSGIPGTGRAAAGLVNKLIDADGPQAVQNMLMQHGSDAMLADAGPSLTTIAGGLARRPAAEGSVVMDALNARAAGSNDRIAAQINASLGPAEDPNAVARNIEALRTQNAQRDYAAALDKAPPVDTSKLVSALDERIGTSEGTVKKALVNLRDMLHEPNPALSVQAPSSSIPVDLGLSGSKPESLVTFLQRAGGVNDEGGDLASMGLNRFPGLIRSNGMSLDRAREAAAEAGHLGANIDDAMQGTYISDLLDKLDQHPTYSMFDEAEVTRRNAAEAARTLPNGDRMSAAQFRQMLQPGQDGSVPTTVPKAAAANLHAIRQELDDVINWDAPGLGVPAGAVANKNGSLKQMRGLLSEALHEQVPGFQKADANFAALADRQNAVENGYNKLLGAGGPHSDTFAADRAAAAPGVNIAQNKGIRGRVDRMFGTGTQRDAVTLNKLLAGGDDGYAAANLRTAFGDEPTSALLDTLARERAFNDTAQTVTRNSVTGRVAEVNKLLEATQPGGLDLKNATATGLALQAGKSAIVDPILRMILESPDAPRNLEVARMLTAQGASRDQIFSALRNLANRQSAVNGASHALTVHVNSGLNRLLLAAGATQRPSFEPAR